MTSGVFLDIKSVLIEEMFVESESTFQGEAHCPTIFFPKFVLIYWKEKYTLSFRINNHKMEDIAYYTHILTLIYQGELYITADNYIDKETSKMYMGDAAYLKYNDVVDMEAGVVYCEYCECKVPVEYYYKEKGYCTRCEKLIIPNIKLH